MRAVKAKMLRRQAEKMTVGQAGVEHMEAGKRVTRTVNGKQHAFWAGRCEVSDRCTRGVYLKLKKMYREARQAGEFRVRGR